MSNLKWGIKFLDWSATFKEPVLKIQQQTNQPKKTNKKPTKQTKIHQTPRSKKKVQKY